MSAAEFALGDRVSFTRELFRETAEDFTSRSWVPREEYPERREGVVVGKRMLNNGIFEVESVEMDGWGLGLTGGRSVYRTTECLTAYLISFDLRRKPVYVLPADMTALTAEPDHCPYDCDSCHDEDCPCDRMGCAGSGVRLDA